MKNKVKAKVKLIYNPKAGKKRKLIPHLSEPTLEDIEELFQRYEIPIDTFPSKSVENAIEMAKSAKSEGYDTVVAAGGDGTVATIAHGLVGSDTNLAILPLGSVMNIARMLSIPFDLEWAVALIKLGRTRKIDLGEIVREGGEKINKPSYFVEQAGVGFDADYRYYLHQFFEKRDLVSILLLLKTFLPLFGPRIEVEIEGEVVEKKARMVIVSNGPVSGLGLKYAPKAKLNDHTLTVSIFNLTKIGLAKFIMNLVLRRKAQTSKVKVIHAKEVKIRSKEEKLIHADARVFGTTPAQFRIKPSCLNVIVGFPKSEDNVFKKRTQLDY